MAEFQVFKYGHVQYPLAAQDSGAKLVSVCSPVIATLLSYFSYRITYYLGGALTGAASGGAAPIASAVEETLAVEPTEQILRSNQLKFPALFVHRMRGNFADHSLNYRQRVSRIGVTYVLPPLSAAQAIKIWPVLDSVADIIDHSVKQGFDPGFNDGQRVFFDNDVGRSRMLDWEILREPFGETTEFRAWSGQLELTETMRPTTDGLPALTGAGIQITDESVQPGNPVEVINADTNP